MHKFIVTVIRVNSLGLSLHAIMEGDNQSDILRQLNRQYPHFCPFDTGINPDYRIYITVID